MPDVISQFLNDVAGGFFGNDYLRDYTHAAKTFRAAFYQNAPKYKFLFHVYFDLNVPGPTDANGSSANNFGLLVKSVKLPNYTFATSELNQYNRKRIIQTKVKYDPVDITFHDDNRNLITSLWYKYFTYYYSDSTKPKVVFAGNRGGLPNSQLYGGGVSGPATEADYNTRTQYLNSITGNDNWGYYGEPLPGITNLSGEPVKTPFFKNITVFGLAQHTFIAYTLINPIITRFGHDTYDYEQGNGIMSNSMTIEYETVVYNQGSLDGNKPDNILTGFGDKANYDRRLSPIATPGSNSNIFGRNGLIESAGGAIQQLTTPNGDILSAIKTAGAVVNSAKNINLKSQLSAELKVGLANALQGVDNPTRQKLIDIPIAGQTPSTVGTAGAPPIAQNSPQNIGNIPNVVNNIVTTGTTTISNTSNIIGGAIGNVIKYAGLQNNTTGKVTSIQP
jgi:hypothetical protein